MNTSTLLGVLVVPAILFAFVYFPLVSQLSRGLVSPYPKADVKMRLLAAAIDGGLVASSGFLYVKSNVLWYIVAGGAYLLLRDAMKGQSIGKLLGGLVVISLETGRPASLTASLRRNALLLLPGANIVAIFLEARTLVRDPQGQRLGDRLAQTQVIEGLGAKDLVKSFQDWLMDLGVEVGRARGKRRRTPAQIDRGRRPAA